MDYSDVCVCPFDHAPLEQHLEALQCEHGHRFPIVRGVPRLHDVESARPIAESFGHEWEVFDYDRDRVWGATPAERRSDLWKHLGVDAEWFAGKRLLDAGCGHGIVANEAAELGAEVVGMDISGSVEAAQQEFGDRVMFLQGDARRPPLASRSFDAVYCGGVLHHTPSPHATFSALTPLVRRDGLFFVWLYKKVPGSLQRTKDAVRRVVAPLPQPIKAAATVPFTAQNAIRHRNDGLSWHERHVIQLDYMTPRWRSTHTPAELEGWFRNAGFVDVRQTEDEKDGFGLVARRAA